MRCSFCRHVGHNKNSCNDTEVVRIQLRYINCISHIVASAYLRRQSPTRLWMDIKAWLNVIALERLKYIFQYLKNRTTWNVVGSCNTKRIIIIHILDIIFHDCHIDVNDEYVSGTTTVYRENIAPVTPPVVAPVVPPVVPPIVPPMVPHVVDLTVDRIVSVAPRPLVRQQAIPIGGVATSVRVLKCDEVCGENEDCPICYVRLENKTFVKLGCSHYFCKNCIKGCVDRKILNCPMCRSSITEISTQNPVVSYSL